MGKRPDYTESLKALRKDAKMAALVKKHGVPDLTRYHGPLNIFESLLRSIIFQQLSGKAARAIHARVLALFPTGSRPAPKVLLKIPAKKLRAAGLSISKISYLRDLAEKCLDGSIDEKRIPAMASDEIIEHLVAVKGVGTWTAQMVLIFTLHRLDILPTGDLGIQKGFQKVYGLRALPKPRHMERLAKPWRDHASVGSWYLWRAVDTN